MVLLETIFLTQSRFILLDMPMLFFIACSVYAYTQVWCWCVVPTMQPDLLYIVRLLIHAGMA
jgi:dolichyl-phosphate-mannose--protein O-mannosyl transferase